MAFLCARRGAPLCRCWPPASPSPHAALSLRFTCFFLGGLSGRARRIPRAPCVCPQLTSALPLPRHPAPSPPVSPSHPYAPPTRCHSEGRSLPPPVSTFLSAVSAFAFIHPCLPLVGFTYALF